MKPSLRSLAGLLCAGTVLAAPVGSDGPGGAVGVLRGSDVDGLVSSVDRLETVSGVTVGSGSGIAESSAAVYGWIGLT